MSAAFITLICVVIGQAEVQTDAEAKTQLYVKTTPPGASVSLDGGTLGKSNGLFDVAPGAHKLVLRMDGYASDERSIEVRQRQITHASRPCSASPRVKRPSWATSTIRAKPSGALPIRATRWNSDPPRGNAVDCRRQALRRPLWP